ncbi:elongation factor G [Desulfopila aestuarii]|uniref:Elongation factor G n=1 Tax=Desulfopila aestuarii DSM 18488 TaxID=1121416 RepID=A0A1M7Y1X3_9BACT|nr:elongation factor G [Desulfopila aestuarii]SHO45860.1 translation elongation factor 2 (EF-2/EF-G) [Desulfopila aestuarii DSM 18488]
MQDTSKVRNIAIIGHGNCGKTSLAEAMLFTAGKINRLGKVDEGTSALDYEDEEISRNISINTSFHNYSWNKHDVYLIDTPGDDNFLNETVFASDICDGVVFTIGAVLGVKGQTIKFAEIVKEKNLPTMIVVNKMDRERANFNKTMDEMRESLPITPTVLHMPIGAEDSFKGFVDVISGKAYLFEGDKGTFTEGEVPSDMVDDLAGYREALMESVAETDDDLIEKFLEEGELTEEEMLTGLKNGVAKGEIAPVCVCAATKNLGTAAVLDCINKYMPSPAERPVMIGTNKAGETVERIPDANQPFSAMVFKTMADPYAGRLTIFRVFSGILQGDHFYNSTKDESERFGQLYVLEGKEQKPVDKVGPGMIVAVAKLKETATGDTLCDAASPIIYEPTKPLSPVITFAVSAKKGDEEKVFGSISKMLDEDLTLKMERQQQTKQTLISGMGQTHLEVVGSRIKRKFGVEMELSKPKVPYMETIRGSARVQGKHKKQSGGRGQFGDCWVEIEPLPGGGYEFVDKIVGGVIPQQYRPAVDKGIQEAMERGVLAGYPVIDVKITLVDGSYHTVDSSEMAFKIAGSLAFKKGAQEAGLVLLEPHVNMEIRVGKDHVGDVMGDLNSRRGKVMGMDSDGRSEIINAQVPQSEMLSYATDLTSMTGGLGTFTYQFSHYEEVPSHIADKIIAERAEDE